MILHREIRHLCRAHALTLAVCTTGSTTLVATTTGYTRAAGSFLDDGFRAGMEVTPDGFPQTAVGTIDAVSATALGIRGGRTAAASASGRTLSVGMPQAMKQENQAYAPVAWVPWVAENYLHGAFSKPGLGARGRVAGQPLYLLRFHLPLDVGADGMDAYMDALISHFAPSTPFTCTNGDVVRVRGDVGPTASPAARLGDRWISTLTVSLTVESFNSR